MTAPRKMRIGLVSAWASRAGGGVFEAVVSHAEMLRGIGFEPVVVALRDEFSGQDRHRFGEVKVVTVETAGPGMIGFAPGMVRALIEARLDALHLHGIWMYPSAAASRWARLTGAPYVISPHGMLDPWILARGRLKKAVARLGYERASWKRASCFHALTADEAEDIRTATGRGDSLVIPNAVEPAQGEARRGPVLAYLGRIHPKKNLDGLIEGWRLAGDVLGPLGARLKIAGWGEEGHLADFRARLAADGGGDIEFLGPAFGAAKAELLGSARFLALPSHSEGLPMTILEAWAAGTPVLMSRHCHLPEGIAAGAAIDCGTGPAAIAAALRQAFGKPEGDWQAMSEAASRLVRERFTPEVVSQRWHEAYSLLLAGQSPCAI